MHWSEKVARQVIERNPDKDEYVCAAGISPSGSVHIGNFRDIATSYFVCQSLRRLGKKARLLFSWDEFDRLRKIPVNVAAHCPGFEVNLGKPYSDAADPFGCCESYAKHFENEFETSLKRFGVDVDFRYQTREYRSGRYAEHIITALKKRYEIFDILDQFRTQETTAEERENYYPVSIFCPVCGKDTTTVTALGENCETAEFTCRCGYTGTFNFRKDFNCKLPWKIDWPMRWMAEKVDFEPGGKDHASPGGSYQTSRIIAEKIYNIQAPLFQGYEFIGIKGTTGKMSGSSGLNLTPDTLLRIYQPELIFWLYAKSDPQKAFDFCFDEEILRQYFEFDKMLTQFNDGSANEFTREVMSRVQMEGRVIHTVPMAQLVSFGSIVDFNPALLETIFAKIGTPYTEAEFSERLGLARYWLEKCSPESMNTLLAARDDAYFTALTPAEQQEIRVLHAYLCAGGYSLDDLMTYLYAIPGTVRGELDERAKKECQARFFKNVYMLLLGKEKGPRLYLFLHAVEREKYIHLLDFAGAV